MSSGVGREVADRGGEGAGIGRGRLEPLPEGGMESEAGHHNRRKPGEGQFLGLTQPGGKAGRSRRARLGSSSAGWALSSPPPTMAFSLVSGLSQLGAPKGRAQLARAGARPVKLL